MTVGKSRFARPGWWAGRFLEIAVALTVFYVSVTLIEYREAVAKSSAPPEEWFTLNELYIPDHKVGSNPLIVYDRTIIQNHRGFWIAEVQKVSTAGDNGLFQNVCTGSGVNDYTMEETLGPNSQVHWDWFFGRPCTIPAGVYRVVLTRDMTIPDWPVKRQRSMSNVFRVSQ